MQTLDHIRHEARAALAEPSTRSVGVTPRTQQTEAQPDQLALIMPAATPPTSASSLVMAAAQSQSQTEWDGYVADKVERFLKETAPRPLLVCMGYASTLGLVWLAERTKGRRVTLVVGDLRSGDNRWKASDASLTAALQFVSRPDVDIRSWDRTAHNRDGSGEAAHLKVWPRRVRAASTLPKERSSGQSSWSAQRTSPGPVSTTTSK